jgi:hypothetical protein
MGSERVICCSINETNVLIKESNLNWCGCPFAGQRPQIDDPTEVRFKNRSIIIKVNRYFY